MFWELRHALQQRSDLCHPFCIYIERFRQDFGVLQLWPLTATSLPLRYRNTPSSGLPLLFQPWTESDGLDGHKQEGLHVVSEVVKAVAK